MNTNSIRLGTTRVLIVAAAVLIGGSSSVYACPVCFGAEETHLIDGAKLGILVLLAITLVGAGWVPGLLPLSPQAREAHRRHSTSISNGRSSREERRDHD